MDAVAAVALAGPRSGGPVQLCGGLAGQTRVTQRLQTARQETGHLRRKRGFSGLWRESVTHRDSRNQRAARGGVFPTQTKRRTRAMGLGKPAGAGLPENRVKRLRGRSPAHSSPMLLPGRCPTHRAAASPPAPRAAGPRMRETPGMAALQTLLRHLHPGLAGRSRAASVEEHVCACGTALWTHIRSLVRKGKLDPQTLQDRDWQRTAIAMNGIEVKLSIKFTSRELSLKRMPSRKQTGVFGVRIAVVTKRERSKVPYIVRQCVEEIERRGMEEVGIYRVSGVATDIQALKAAFDVNNKDVSVMMSEMDVNAIAGTLKLYFRELPEPLFTDEFYPNFAEGIALSDPVAKESCMLNLLLSLPEANLLTFLFLLEHLKRVAEKETVNKMSLHNLATVFGPTLLRPSEKENKPPANPSQAISMTDSWSLEVMSQVQVLLYFLQLEAIPAPDSRRQSVLFSTEV